MMDELAQLRSTIDRADNTYYRTGKAIMPDREYDALKARLRQLAPADERHTRVGPAYTADEIGTKSTHKIPMGSLDNIDGGLLGIQDWYDDMYQKLKLTGNGGDTLDIMMSLKVDGSSLVLNYDEQGKLQSAVTRGNGSVGDDVTANAVMFQGVPTVLPRPVACSVRGEAVLHKSDFQQLTAGQNPDEISNERNTGNGIVGREDGTQSELMRFYAFNLFEEHTLADFVQGGVVRGFPHDEYITPGYCEQSPSIPLTEEVKFARLSELGFQTVPHRLAHSAADMELFYHETLACRATGHYHIDGLVAVLNRVEHQQKFITADPRTRLRPKYARAIKFPAYTAITTVTGVIVTVGHNRVVCPTLAVKPVRIGAGITADSVIVTNYDEIRRQDVAIGDEVEIFLAGDVIPNLSRVIQKSINRRPIVEPVSCPACGCPTSRESRGKEGANLYCTNLDCEAALVRKIGHWCGTSKKGIGIMDIGDTMIQALWGAGLVRDPADLYTLTPDLIADVTTDKGVRIGHSRAETIYNNIQSKRAIPLHLFLGGLGIDLLGTRRVQLLVQAAGGKLDTLEDWLSDFNLATLNIAGMMGGESITRAAIRQGIDHCRPLISKLLAVGVVATPLGAAQAAATTASATDGQEDGSLTTSATGPETVPAAQPLAGKSFCFTGTRECIAQVETLGGTINDDVRKGTTYLVYKPARDGRVTNKAAKAERLGTKVITLDLLKQVLDGQAELP